MIIVSVSVHWLILSFAYSFIYLLFELSLVNECRAQLVKTFINLYMRVAYLP